MLLYSVHCYMAWSEGAALAVSRAFFGGFTGRAGNVTEAMRTAYGRLFKVVLVLLATVFAIAGCSVSPPQGITPVAPFELERYLGTWYEIARLDHVFERNLDNVTAQYSMRPDGNVEVVNSGFHQQTGERKEAVGIAKPVGLPERASLKVSFFRPFYSGYHVVALDADYQWAMVIGQSRKYFWILARKPELPAGTRERLLEQAAAFGIDVSALIWVAQGRHGS